MGFFSEAAEKEFKRRKISPGGIPKVEFVSSGLFAFDYATGGGFPRQRVTEISGKNGNAKSTLSMIAAAKAIENGGYVALIETENTLDLKWLNTLGIPNEEIYEGEDDKKIEECHLHIWHPDYLESALQTILTLHKEDKYELIILDSFGASPVRAAAEGTMEDTVMMKRARVGSQFKELMSANLTHGHSAIVIVNQVYLNSNQPYYDKLKPEGGYITSSGGESIQFLSALRVYMELPLKVEDKEKQIIGKDHRGMVFKNKTGRNVPQRFIFRLMINEGSYINYAYDIRTTALELGVIEQRGKWWYYQGENVAGSEAAIDDLIINSPIGLNIELELANKLKGDLNGDQRQAEQSGASTENAEVLPESSSNPQF